MSNTVAVLMPCYNNGDYVADAIESVLAQTQPADEIVIVDDGSTDHSKDVIAGFGDSVRCIRQPNSGRAAAMNRALAATQCDLVAIIDADDLWWPKLLEKNVAALIDNEAVMAYCLGTLCDQHGNILGRQYGMPMQDDVMRCMLTDNHVFGGGPVLRRQTVIEAGGYDATFWPCDDYHLWLRMSARGKIEFQTEPLAVYRMHTGQVSNQVARMARQKLAAKLDFLANHPHVEEEVGRSFVRQVTEDEFYKTCNAQFEHGNIQVAQEMIQDYLRRYPIRPRGWWQFTKTQLPWRINKHLVRPTPPTAQSPVPSA
jgi:glycosyltransferase involved in cell wall biosynthesis